MVVDVGDVAFAAVAGDFAAKSGDSADVFGATSRPAAFRMELSGDPMHACTNFRTQARSHEHNHTTTHTE